MVNLQTNDSELAFFKIFLNYFQEIVNWRKNKNHVPGWLKEVRIKKKKDSRTMENILD